MYLKRLNKNAILPVKKLGNAGFDIAIQVPEGSYELKPNEFKTFGTGYAIWLKDPRLELQIRSRSKLGTQKGIIVTQGIGTIDSTYQGELMVSLHNISNKPFVIEDGMLVAQGIVAFVAMLTTNPTEYHTVGWWERRKLHYWFIEVEEFETESERGSKGINCEELRLTAAPATAGKQVAEALNMIGSPSPSRLKAEQAIVESMLTTDDIAWLAAFLDNCIGLKDFIHTELLDKVVFTQHKLQTIIDIEAGAKTTTHRLKV